MEMQSTGQKKYSLFLFAALFLIMIPKGTAWADDPPVVLSTSIQNDSITVPVSSAISVEFNEPLAPTSVSADSVLLSVNTGTNPPVPGSIMLSTDRKTITFAPSALLTAGTKYKLTITNAVTDDAGVHASSL